MGTILAGPLLLPVVKIDDRVAPNLADGNIENGPIELPSGFYRLTPITREEALGTWLAQQEILDS